MRWSSSRERLRGVAVADADTPADDLRRWHALGVRGLRFNHFFRDGQLHYRGGVPLEAAACSRRSCATSAGTCSSGSTSRISPDTIPTLKSIGLPVVIDHMGRTDAQLGTSAPGFQALLRLLGDGGCWVKLSGAHRVSRAAPDYPDARAFHEALVATNPDQLVWGSDWPHPRMEGEMPDAGHLLDLFNAWTPDDAIRRRILADNPARLYDFPVATAASGRREAPIRDSQEHRHRARWIPARAMLRIACRDDIRRATSDRYIRRRSGS